uniref:Uncharacterized protein n=1 Tax=Oryza sativa subsp. japonica TaxID=39947 RepID=Q8H436_ORYSJ|nr:hypothetical protein [Oryza sativa Japonica Group]
MGPHLSSSLLSSSSLPISSSYMSPFLSLLSPAPPPRLRRNCRYQLHLHHHPRHLRRCRLRLHHRLVALLLLLSGRLRRGRPWRAIAGGRLHRGHLDAEEPCDTRWEMYLTSILVAGGCTVVGEAAMTGSMAVGDVVKAAFAYIGGAQMAAPAAVTRCG